MLRITVIMYTMYTAAASRSNECLEHCVALMEKSTPMLTAASSLRADSPLSLTTESSFNVICSTYREVDDCFNKCNSSPDSSRIRQTYAGLRFICIEANKEFFANLPCFAKEETRMVSDCRPQINASLLASQRFSAAVNGREQHAIRHRFEGLCKQLGAMIDCVEPITRDGCGEQAAWMLMRFITVGFGSFEQLYSQLGMSDTLPPSCRSLISLRHQPLDRVMEARPLSAAALLRVGVATLLVLYLNAQR